MADPLSRLSAEEIERKAEATLKQAKNPSFFTPHSTTEERFNDAASQFSAAGAKYREKGNLMRAGDLYKRSYDTYQDQMVTYPKDLIDTAGMVFALKEAYKAYTVSSPQKAIPLVEKYIEIRISASNFREAANAKSRLADLEVKVADLATDPEERRKHLESAKKAWEKAIEWYTQDDGHSTANAERQKLGEFLAMNGAYYDAIVVFKQAADACSNFKYSSSFMVKAYLFKAAFCQVAQGDAGEVNRFISELPPAIQGEPEFQTLGRLVGAMQHGDEDEFEKVATDLGLQTKLDEWMKAVLRTVQETVGSFA